MRSWRLARGGLVWFLLHLAAGAVSAAEDVGGKLWCSGNGYPPSPRGGVISLQYRMLHGRSKLMRLRMRTQFWRATAFVAVGLLGAGSWSEKTATGTSASALGTLGTGNIGVSAGAAESFVSIDVTAAVQTWRDGLLANNGLALVAHSGSSLAISVDSKEKGPQGLKGDTGATGATGPQGPAGSNGPSGPAGPTGAAGADGATGPAGPQGPQGPQGLQGHQGDAGAAGTPGVPGL